MIDVADMSGFIEKIFVEKLFLTHWYLQYFYIQGNSKSRCNVDPDVGSKIAKTTLKIAHHYKIKQKQVLPINMLLQ